MRLLNVIFVKERSVDASVDSYSQLVTRQISVYNEAF